MTWKFNSDTRKFISDEFSEVFFDFLTMSLKKYLIFSLPYFFVLVVKLLKLNGVKTNCSHWTSNTAFFVRTKLSQFFVIQDLSCYVLQFVVSIDDSCDRTS